MYVKWNEGRKTLTNARAKFVRDFLCEIRCIVIPCARNKMTRDQRARRVMQNRYIRTSRKEYGDKTRATHDSVRHKGCHAEM